MSAKIYYVLLVLLILAPIPACGGSGDEEQALPIAEVEEPAADELAVEAPAVEEPAVEESEAEEPEAEEVADIVSVDSASLVYVPDNNPCIRDVWTFGGAGGGGGEEVILFESDEADSAVIGKLTHEGISDAAFVFPEGQLIMTHAAGDDIRIWDAAAAEEKLRLQRDGGLVKTTLSRENGLLAAADGQGKVWLWDLNHIDSDRGVMVVDIGLHEYGWSPISAVELSPDGSVLAVAESTDSEEDTWYRRWGIIHLFDTSTGEELRQLEGEIITEQETGEIEIDGDVYEQVTAATMQNGHAAPINWLGFSPDSLALFSGSTVGPFGSSEGADSTIRIWDISSGEHVRCLEIDAYKAGPSAAVSPDGREVATASSDSVLIWDTATSQVVRQFALPDVLRLAIDSVSYSPDGSSLITITLEEQAVRVWDAQSGRLSGLLRHPDFVRSADFSPDSRQILTGTGHWSAEGSTGEAWVWNAGHSSLNLAAAAQAIVDEGLERGAQGDINGMFLAFDEAQNSSLEDGLLLRPAILETACRLGILEGRAGDVLAVCDLALTDALAAGYEEYQLAKYYDNRGTARALTGDYDGAIDDFQFYVNTSFDSLHQTWIEALSEGDNQPVIWDLICRKGSPQEKARETLDACDRAIEAGAAAGLDGWELVDYYDARGIARALTGDYDGAIDDFQFVNPLDVLRRSWIEALSDGVNPFDEATLEALRDE